MIGNCGSSLAADASDAWSHDWNGLYLGANAGWAQNGGSGARPRHRERVVGHRQVEQTDQRRRARDRPQLGLAQRPGQQVGERPARASGGGPHLAPARIERAF